jgi:hypothetical protein
MRVYAWADTPVRPLVSGIDKAHDDTDRVRVEYDISATGGTAVKVSRSYWPQIKDLLDLVCSMLKRIKDEATKAGGYDKLDTVPGETPHVFQYDTVTCLQTTISQPCSG